MNPMLIIMRVAILVLGIGFFLAGGVFGLLMMEEVDRQKPGLNVYSAFGSFGRRLNRGRELYRQYRSLCPNGKLHIYELASFAFGMACFITSLFLINP